MSEFNEISSQNFVFNLNVAQLTENFQNISLVTTNIFWSEFSSHWQCEVRFILEIRRIENFSNLIWSIAVIFRSGTCHAVAPSSKKLYRRRVRISEPLCRGTNTKTIVFLEFFRRAISAGYRQAG